VDRISGSVPIHGWGQGITENERFWIEGIRLASRGRDAPPTLDKVQKLNAIFGLLSAAFLIRYGKHFHRLPLKTCSSGAVLTLGRPSSSLHLRPSRAELQNDERMVG
jgi:hypothetical protein